MPTPTQPEDNRHPTTRHGDPGTGATGAEPSIEAELAAQPSTIEGAVPTRSRRRRIGVAALVAAGLVGVIGLTYISDLGQDVQTERDQTGATLSQVAQATVAACRDGVIIPAPTGITACAEAIKATPGPVDPASVAALVRSIIGVTDPTARFDPRVIAAQLADLLPGLPGQVVAAVVDAQVAAAQGSATPGDAQQVTEEAVTPVPGPGAAAPVPTGAPGPSGVPDESDRPDDAPPVDPRDDDTPAPPVVEPSAEPEPEPSEAPRPEPSGPAATDITFSRDEAGRCTAVTSYDDGTRAVSPADDQSCPAAQDPAAPTPGSTSGPSTSTDVPDDGDDPGLPPLISVN